MTIDQSGQLLITGISKAAKNPASGKNKALISMNKAESCTLIRLCRELMSGLSLLLLSRCLEECGGHDKATGKGSQNTLVHTFEQENKQKKKRDRCTCVCIHDSTNTHFLLLQQESYSLVKFCQKAIQRLEFLKDG